MTFFPGSPEFESTKIPVIKVLKAEFPIVVSASHRILSHFSERKATLTSLSVFIAHFFIIHSALSARAMDSDGVSQMRNAEEAGSQPGGFRSTSLRQGKGGKGKSKSKFDEGKSKSTLGADFDSDKEDSDSDGGKGKNRRIGVGQERYCDEDSDDDPGHQVSGKGKGQGKDKSGKVGMGTDSTPSSGSRLRNFLHDTCPFRKST